MVEFVNPHYTVPEDNGTEVVCITLSSDTRLQDDVVLNIDYVTVDGTAEGELQ